MTSLVASAPPDIGSTYVSPSRTGGRADRSTAALVHHQERRAGGSTSKRSEHDPSKLFCLACAKKRARVAESTDRLQYILRPCAPRLAAVRVHPATSHLLPMPSIRLPASIHVRLAYTQPRHPSTSSAQRPSSAQRNVSLMLVRCYAVSRHYYSICRARPCWLELKPVAHPSLRHCLS